MIIPEEIVGDFIEKNHISVIQKAGLNLSAHKLFRHFDLGDYGIPDFLGISYWKDAASRKIEFDIVELKTGKIDSKAVSQVCRYKQGIEDYLCEIGEYPDEDYFIRTTIIGNSLETTYSPYLLNQLGISIFSYSIHRGKIKFTESYKYECPKENRKHRYGALTDFEFENIGPEHV